MTDHRHQNLRFYHAADTITFDEGIADRLHEVAAVTIAPQPLPGDKAVLGLAHKMQQPIGPSYRHRLGIRRHQHVWTLAGISPDTSDQHRHKAPPAPSFLPKQSPQPAQ